MAVAKRIANKNAQEYVNRAEPFQGSNLFGEYDDSDEGSNTPYVVYSYGYHFPMFIYLNNIWYENSDKYSVSTSKHQSQSHPMMDTVKLNTEDMKRLLWKNTQERINQ